MKVAVIGLYSIQGHRAKHKGMKSQLQPYSGPLSAAQITSGIAAAQTNAIRLLEDARLLAKAARFPSATALAILAIEERGKVIVLKRLALVSEAMDVRATWKEYRNHRAKNAGWIIPYLVKGGARTMGALGEALDASGEHTSLLDGLKQISFYTDCLGNRHWSVPEAVIDADVARSMIAAAEMMWGARPVSLREVELWREIVGPHYRKPTMADAVLRYQAAMNAEGLSDTSVESLRAFMEGEPSEPGS